MPASHTSPAFPSPAHDHQQCREQALVAAERACADQGKRLTPLRRRVLELVWAGHHPVKAYDLLEQLREEQGKVAPPTVYRALDFLEEAGLIHRLASNNAFVGCPRPGHGGPVRFLLCRACGTVAEQPMAAMADRITEEAEDLGFRAERPLLEITGLCPQCRQEPSSSSVESS